MKNESTFLKKLMGEALPKLPKLAFVSFGSSYTIGFPENTSLPDNNVEELNSHQGFSEMELATLRLIFQKTIADGSAGIVKSILTHFPKFIPSQE